MARHRMTLPAVLGGLLLGLLAPGQAMALTDTHGREWRQLNETTNVSWNQAAAACPQNGVTACTGTAGGKNLDGWVWATDAQVLELLREYEPTLATTSPTSVSGFAYFGTASTFLSVMRYTTSGGTNYSYNEWTGGWTASKDASGTPIGAGAGWGHAMTTASGSFGVGPQGTVDEQSYARGIWLWRPAGDYSAPVITPNVAGTLGTNGWYVSNVTVSWSATDPESPVSSTTGCGTVTITSNTTGKTLTCKATSAGGTATASTTIRRDIAPPVVTCQTPAPSFTIGQIGITKVSADVTDAISGPAASPVDGLADTRKAGSFTATVTGRDRAGNTTARQCPYKVVVPPCRGLKPTIVGTAGNDVIAGTSGRDIIIGLGGADEINGSSGNDVICGGDGDDEIDGGSGTDVIDGDGGNDELKGGDGDDTLDGGAGSDDLTGQSGRDTCTSGEVRMNSCEVIT